jgi:hypothetical protein
MFQGHCFTTWGLPGDEPNDSSYVNATRSFEDHWNRFVAKTDYKELISALNKLYGDERNSKVEIQHALWIAMNVLAGTPEANLELMIEAWREKDGRLGNTPGH